MRRLGRYLLGSVLAGLLTSAVVFAGSVSYGSLPYDTAPPLSSGSGVCVGDLTGTNANGPGFRCSTAASSTVPTLLPDKTVTTAGMGYNSGGSALSLITSGVEEMFVGPTLVLLGSNTLRVRNNLDNDTGALAVNDDLTVASKLTLTPQQSTIADNGAGTNATLTLTPTGSTVRLTCSDANGCDITMSETGAVDGQRVTITNFGSTACNFADTAGVSELGGAYAMGQYDSITLTYQSDRWVEDARSNN